jgi:hypothetical protein
LNIYWHKVNIQHLHYRQDDDSKVLTRLHILEINNTRTHVCRIGMVK